MARIRILFHLYFILFTYLCVGLKRNMKFEKLPNSATLEGLGCAIEKHDTERGVRFDTQKDMCSGLSDAWFTNPTYNTSQNYFKISMLEPLFQENNTLTITIPSNFVVGSSIVMYMTTNTVGNTGGSSISIHDVSFSNAVIYANVRENENTLLFNSLINGHWGYEERNPNPFTVSNKRYKLELKLTSSQMQLYIDDSLFYGYNHRTSISSYQVLHYSSTYTTCDSLQFLYPA